VTQVTDALIARLAEGLHPVKRLPPPWQRTLTWLAVVAALSLALIVGFSRLGIFMNRIRDPKLMLELAATLVTGVLAVLASFELSLPDRPLRWALLPLPSFALWLGSSGYSCWRHWITNGPEGFAWGETPRCLAWIVAFGIPLGISLFILLRRSNPLDPGPVAALAGLGAASIAAFLLQFFHPFDVTFIDLGLHLAGVFAVVALARAVARPAFEDSSTGPWPPPPQPQ
jgi:hypothetical protein